MLPKARHLLLAFNALLMTGAPAVAQARTAADGEWREAAPGLSGIQGRQAETEGDPDVRLTVLAGPASPGAEGPAPAPGALQGVRIGSVLVETSAGIDHALFKETIEPFLGLQAGSEDLERLTQEIAAVARAQGMVLADAHIPAQQVELGIIRVVLLIGVIDEVRIEGAQNQALNDLLEPLVGQVVVQRELERRLMLANDIPAVKGVSAELINEGGRRILVVKLDARPETSGRIVFENYGSKSVGPLRGRLKLDAVAWLEASDILSATVQANPVDPNELLAASLAYSIGLNDLGTRAGGVFATSRSSIPSGLDFSRRDISSQYVSAVISHPLRRLRGSNAWLEGQIEHLEVEQEIAGAVFATDTIVTLSASLATSLKVRNGWLRSGAQVRQGLDTLGASRAGDPISSRNDADGQFTSVRGWINWSGKPAGDWTLNLALYGQIANEPLLAPEEIGVGGVFAGRAFEPYQVYGDQGILGSAELGYEYRGITDWLGRLQPYAFLDGGNVDQLDDGLGGGGLMSSGGGVRAQIGRVGLQLETAVPIYQSGPDPADTEPKVNFQLGLDF